MANSQLTPSVITKEALAVLHQKLNFIGNIHRGYDDQYAQKGAKIGNDLKIRMPNEFTVRSGATLNAVDVVERSETLTVDRQRGVDMNFTSEELTLHIDEFKERYIEPAMSVLAAHMENDALSMYKNVYNFYDLTAGAMTVAGVANARKLLTDNLAPSNDRAMLHGTQSTVDLNDAVKGLYHDSTDVKRQYREGIVGRIGGFDHFESTLMPNHTTGTAAEGDTSYNINAAGHEAATAAEIAAGTQTIIVDTGTTTFKAGDIITIANVNRCHPETKADTGQLQRFVVTTDADASATTLVISPPMIDSAVDAPRQNVVTAGQNNAAINKLGGGNAATWDEALAFQKGAFCFATADLIKPEGVHWCGREVLDGISMRIVRDYDITNDKFPCRLDVMYGYKAVRPQLACRVSNNT